MKLTALNAILCAGAAMLLAAPVSAQMQNPPSADPNAAMPQAPIPPDTAMQPADPTVPRDPAAPVGSPQNPVVVGGNVTPPPPTPQDYPLCSRTVRDSCQNPGEGPRTRGKKRPA